jgi:hypothetical protein
MKLIEGLIKLTLIVLTVVGLLLGGWLLKAYQVRKEAK